MVELEYRSKTSSTSEISRWRKLLLEEGGSTWDYRSAPTRLTYLEIRIKPKFVPGYFRDTTDNEVVWFEDEGPTCPERVRVNVTPAE
jgi:hypothetical protein